MIQSAIRFRYPHHTLVLSAALVVTISSWARAQAVEKPQARSGGPAIANIDVGIKGHFKIGSWMPVRVDVRDANSLKNPSIEVTVPDSDGVPTTAAAGLSTQSSDTHTRSALVYTKLGRSNGAIQVALFDGDAR